ncbi:hypothetical protein JG687_00011600 [Phytophthora cactorum]|uniref:DNA repair protein REV1 n=1 Tax=Phytophthora cactorum TaxID=29920 RepID=A0A8T1U609_9STRA|nr:hypothetical protein JG687_00011600 [Phytophthora cactorum]
MRRRGDGVDGVAGRKRVGEHHDGSFGLYMSHKVQKLRGQNESFTAAASPDRASSGNNAGIFQGIHVYVDGYTVPSKEEIRQLMLLHGGGFEHYETGRVTHIVATHLPASKLLQLKKARKPLPVVHPDWIVQSIEQNKLLPVQSFLYAGFIDPTQNSIFSLPGSGLVSPAQVEDKRSSYAAASASKNTEEGEEEEDELDVPEDPPASPPPQLTSKKSSNTTLKLRTNSTRDGPEFVRHFFAKSRLHHIGTWRATFQQKAAEFQAKYKGMFMQTAKELCPELIVLPYQFDAIERVSFQIYDIFFSHTPYVQAVSCDEAFLEFGRGMNGMEKANTIRKKIFEQTGCSASVGVSFNVLLAKLSSKKAKPDGIFQIADSSQAEEFMLQLKIRDLPGAGHMTASGEMLYNYARGIDLRPLSMESNMMRKSVSAVVNFGIRFEKWEDVTVFLMALGEELSHRLRNLKVKVGDIFDYYTSSDGILQAPKWKSFLYAVEDYLENDPRLTYHPSRVRHFIEENGIDNLEKME